MSRADATERGPTKKAALQLAFESLTGRAFDETVEYFTIGDENLVDSSEGEEGVRYSALVTYDREDFDADANFALNGTVSRAPDEVGWEAHLYTEEW